MSVFDAFRYGGKRALVVGGATGMGAATAELLRDSGADVTVMDIAPVELEGSRTIQVDLADPTSIDAALADLDGPMDALFSCAGVADGTPGIEKINFLGHRHMIDRLLEADRLPRGSAIGFISSAAGLGWEAGLDLLTEYLDTPDFEAGAAWIEKNGHADYMWSKQAICADVARQAFPLLQRGIRINAICPGPTDTPLASKEHWLGHGADYRQEAGIEASTPAEQAFPLVFLCSDAAAVVTGTVLITDAGYISSGLTGSYPGAVEFARFLCAR